MNSSENSVKWTTLDVVFALAALLGGVFLMQALGVGAAGSTAASNALTMAATYGFIAFVVLVFTVIKYRARLADLGFRSFKPGRVIVSAAALWFAVRIVIFVYSAVATGVAARFGVKPPAEMTNQVSDLFGPGLTGFILAVAIAVVVGPVVEEVFFRGFIYPAFRLRMGVWPAIALSSLIFGVFHVNPWIIGPTMLMGAAMAWLYERDGSLAGPIFFHMLNNLVSVVIVYTLLMKS